MYVYVCRALTNGVYFRLGGTQCAGHGLTLRVNPRGVHVDTACLSGFEPRRKRRMKSRFFLRQRHGELYIYSLIYM